MTESMWTALVLIVLCGSQDARTSTNVSTNQHEKRLFECSRMNKTAQVDGGAEHEQICNIDDIRHYSIVVVPDYYCNVQCKSITNMNMDGIRLLDLGSTANLKYFLFDRCPLPAEPTSYADIMRHLGVEYATQVKIKNIYLNNSIERRHLRGLDGLNVTYLNLYDGNITNVPEDLFQDLPNLMQLNLSTNKLRVSGRIFKDLKKLRVLMASDAELTDLPQDLFALPSLVKLYLSENALKLTSRTFHGAASLKTLDLSLNSLRDLPQDVFRELRNLQDVVLSENNFTTLPDDLFMDHAKLKNIDLEKNSLTTISPMLFGKLENLEILNLSVNHIFNLPEQVFHNSSRLIEIKLEYNNMEELPGRIFSNQAALKRLSLGYNQLKTLPKNIFKHLRSLEELHLNNNLIRSLGSAVFNGLDKLETLNLQFNHLTHIEFPANLHIRKLDASCNLLGQWSDYFESPFKLPGLERLDLHNNSIDQIYSDWQHQLNNLTDLNLSYNKIRIQSFADNLHFIKDQPIKVDLTHNNITGIDWPDYNKQLWHGGHNVDIVISDNPLICDCWLHSFVQYQKNTPHIEPRVKIIAENTKCAGPQTLAGRLLSDIEPEDLTCEQNLTLENFNECVLIKKPHTQARIVNCSHGHVHGHLNSHRLLDLSALEQQSVDYNHTELVLEYNNLTSLAFIGKIPKNVTVLKLRGNNLSLGDHDIPDHIEELDLRDNNLTYINKLAAENILGGSASRKLHISQNLFACDCDNYYFLSLVSHSKKVLDYNSATCSDSTALQDIHLGHICKHTYLVVLGVLGAISIIVTIAYCRYQIALKAWLARNVPWLRKYILPSVSVNDDEDLKKDVFVSYSHFNVDDVLETLMPLLERLHYTTLFHERDWVPGMRILDSIENSVRESQTTIFFVTPEFVRSEWSCHEFMVASARQVEECCAHNIIVIVKGDVDLIAKKNKQIRRYIKRWTYLKWDDPSFEDKLTLALPERLAVKACDKSDDIKISLPINIIIRNAPDDAAKDISR